MKILCCFLVLCALLTLSACGKISSPVPPEGSGYPHSYPAY